MTAQFQEGTSVQNPVVNKSYIDSQITVINSSIEKSDSSITYIKSLISEDATQINPLIDKDYVDSAVTDIQDLIPDEASPVNQLADKNYVNSSIEIINSSIEKSDSSITYIKSLIQEGTTD